MNESAIKDETTPLISAPSSNGGSVATSTDDEITRELDAELEQPWPATFERAVSLLASPTIGTPRDVDRMTRSPLRSVQVTPLLLEARRKIKHDVSLNVFSIGLIMYMLLWVAFCLKYDQFLESPKMLFRQRSMDGAAFGTQVSPARSFDEEEALRMERKQAEPITDAHVYRQKILKQQQKTGIVTKAVIKKKHESSAMYSPGMQKEKQTDKIRKKQKEEVHHGAAGHDATATFAQCVFNLANILMVRSEITNASISIFNLIYHLCHTKGVGLLGLPFVCKSAGWIEGTLVLCLFAVVCWRTAILIGRCLNGDPRPTSEFSNPTFSSPFKSPIPPGTPNNKAARILPPMKSYPEMARKAFGRTGGIVLSCVLYFELFSCLAIFIVSMGEHMNELVPSLSSITHDIILTCALCIPTALLRTPKLLSYLSAVGTVATILVVLAVIANTLIMGNISAEVMEIQNGHDLGTTDKMQDGHDVVTTILYHKKIRLQGIPLALGLVAFCFSGHAVVPSIFTSMAKPHEFEPMVHTTFAIVLAACLSVGLCGYYTFGDAVFDQVTLSLASEPRFGDSHAVTILTWLMVITAFSKCTLTLFPLALGMEEIVAPWFKGGQPWQEIVTSLAIRIGLLFSALLVAIYVPSFSLLCSLVGLICTMAVSVAFPAGTHLLLFKSHLSTTDKIVDYLFIIFGIISAVVGTIATVAQH